MLFNEQFLNAEVEYRRERMMELAGRRAGTRSGQVRRPVVGRVRSWLAGHGSTVR